jgi:hypothetical protein
MKLKNPQELVKNKFLEKRQRRNDNEGNERLSSNLPASRWVQGNESEKREGEEAASRALKGRTQKEQSPGKPPGTDGHRGGANEQSPPPAGLNR